jgi:threonine/homoserine/homoserine lactone efflux protein
VIDHFAAFVVVSAVVIVTPGPDTALTIRNALLGGRRGGVLTALGVSTGQLVWAIASAAGIAALLEASEPAFVAVRIAGAAYLVFLGAQTLFRAVRAGGEDAAATQLEPAPGSSGRTSLRQGIVSNLGNPKMAIFFASLLPQFAGQGSFAGGLLLGIVFAAMTFAWLAAYAVGVARAGDILRRPRIRRALAAVTGTALVALGLRVAADRS